jgi:hypothetical protein
VKFAVFGALPEENADNAKAFDITQKLQDLINANAAAVAFGFNNFGDPSPGDKKHFGAVVERNGIPATFACEEDQTIDFTKGGGNERPFPPGDPNPKPTGNLTVKFATYGALAGGDRSNAQACDVSAILQVLLNKNSVVVFNNANFIDSSPGNLKHFAAVVNRDGRDFAFACGEGQTINFENGGS